MEQKWSGPWCNRIVLGNILRQESGGHGLKWREDLRIEIKKKAWERESEEGRQRPRETEDANLFKKKFIWILTQTPETTQIINVQMGEVFQTEQMGASIIQNQKVLPASPKPPLSLL